MKQWLITAVLVVAATSAAIPARAADSAADMYARALARERDARSADSNTSRTEMRRIVLAYEAIVRRYPTSGYSDNALWQAANLSKLMFDRFGNTADRAAARTLYGMLVSEYPSSSLVPRAKDALRDADNADASPSAPSTTSPPVAVEKPQPEPARVDGDDAPKKADGEPAKAAADPITLLKDIQRSLLPDGVRVTIDLDREVTYQQEEIDGPPRVFFDLKDVRAAPALKDATLKFDDDVVREIRVGRHPQNTTRVVLDLRGVEAYSVYPMYGPYRLVIDFKRAAASKATAAPPPAMVPSVPATPPATELNPAPAPAHKTSPEPKTRPEAKSVTPSPDPKPPLPSKPAPTVAVAPPATNSNGTFSLSRQLGLGVSRIVIDAGHGGHDPGAQGSGIRESELTLDVALRLQKLLAKEPGIDVIMTRDTDVFIPLEERTAIANREGADLFLSIHANASRNASARGVETYFLNFATNPEAEAVAARENAGSGQSMHSLPDIVKAIALNNKINESHDFAETVQKSMVRKLRTRNKTLRDLGVKQAPFVVLIGAEMPSVLAEISFLTHKQEGALLKSGGYRQQIAQALFDAVIEYQRALKKQSAVSAKKATQ